MKRSVSRQRKFDLASLEKAKAKLEKRINILVAQHTEVTKYIQSIVAALAGTLEK